MVQLTLGPISENASQHILPLLLSLRLVNRLLIYLFFVCLFACILLPVFGELKIFV